MSIVRNFNLYLNAGNGSAPYINVNQYDQGEQWVFTLYKEDGTKYTPSTGAIVGIKADNRGIINTGTVDAEGRVVINETQQMTASAGRAIYELSIDGLTHGTANFIVAVERKPTDDAVMSDSDLSLIQEAVDAASEIENLLDGQDVPTVITPIITDWLEDNITNPSNPPIDTSLTVAGAAADAKVTGDEITDLKSDLEEYTVDGYNLLKDAENGAGAYYASGSTLTFNASYTNYHYAIVPVEPNSRYYVSTSPRWWVLTDDGNNVLSSGAGFSPVTKRFIDTGTATKLYYTIDNGTWNNEVNYGSKFALIIAKTNNGSGTLVGDKKPKAISGFTQRMSKNRYAFAVPRSRVMLTVGINQKWFYKNALALDSNTCVISSTYSDYEPDGVVFNVSSPNANAEFFAHAYDQNLARVEQQSKITLIAKADNVMDCSALVIGDSTVAQNKMTELMLNAFANRNKTLTLLGTQGTSPNNHEGRSGWSAKQYCTQSANNPFYNNGFDFSHYMTNQGYSSVDFVVVQLGINDLFNAYGNFEDSDTAIDTTLGYLCDIINSILSWNASQKIIINLLTPVNPTWAGFPMVLIRNIFVRYNAKALIELTKYSLDNVRVSNCHLILDPYTDISDNVHPTSTGYEKMGMEVVSQINCWQN